MAGSLIRGSLFLLVALLLLEKTEAHETNRKNILLICIDDLRPELGCYGVEYIQSPNIDRLAKQGRIFNRHYVQAPTCGASRYTLLTGQYGSGGNGALFQRSNRLKKSPDSVKPSMPAWFRQKGYTTVSVGKVSHHPGGRGGKDWNSPDQIEMPNSWTRHLLPAGAWKHPRGWMHGLANGEIRNRAKDMDVFQATQGSDSIYPDGVSMKEALNQLEILTEDDKPFFLAVGILRPHLPFGAPAKYLEPYKDIVLTKTPFAKKPVGKTTWHGSGEFMKYNRWKRNPNQDEEFALEVRRHYAACVSFADAQVGKLIKALEQSGKRKETIIVLWGDHGWHLGEHAVWGKHTLFEESLRSPLIVSYPSQKRVGEKTNAIVETLDLFPTLCDLASLEIPAFVHGTSLKPQCENPDAAGRFAISYAGNRKTVRTDTHRLILHGDGFTELYDHQTKAKESVNVSERNPKIVQELKSLIEQRLPTPDSK